MKQRWLARGVVVFLSYSNISYTNQLTVEYVHHTIVNNRTDFGQTNAATYQFVDPAGAIHKGNISPGDLVTINLNSDITQPLAGVYVLQYMICKFFCYSYSQSILVENNADIIWELGINGILVTKTNL